MLASDVAVLVRTPRRPRAGRAGGRGRLVARMPRPLPTRWPHEDESSTAPRRAAAPAVVDAGDQVEPADAGDAADGDDEAGEVRRLGAYATPATGRALPTSTREPPTERLRSRRGSDLDDSGPSTATGYRPSTPRPGWRRRATRRPARSAGCRHEGRGRDHGRGDRHRGRAPRPPPASSPPWWCRPQRPRPRHVPDRQVHRPTQDDDRARPAAAAGDGERRRDRRRPHVPAHRRVCSPLTAGRPRAAARPAPAPPARRSSTTDAARHHVDHETPSTTATTETPTTDAPEPPTTTRHHRDAADDRSRAGVDHVGVVPTNPPRPDRWPEPSGSVREISPAACNGGTGHAI